MTGVSRCRAALKSNGGTTDAVVMCLADKTLACKYVETTNLLYLVDLEESQVILKRCMPVVLDCFAPSTCAQCWWHIDIEKGDEFPAWAVDLENHPQDDTENTLDARQAMQCEHPNKQAGLLSQLQSDAKAETSPPILIQAQSHFIVEVSDPMLSESGVLDLAISSQKTQLSYTRPVLCRLYAVLFLSKTSSWHCSSTA